MDQIAFQVYFRVKFYQIFYRVRQLHYFGEGAKPFCTVPFTYLESFYFN